MIIYYLLINGLFSMFSGFLMYIFLKFNFKYTCSVKRLFAFLVAFGMVSGVASTLWMKYINLPRDFQMFKSIVIIILSVYTIKITLKTNWARTIVSFFMILVGIGIGNYLSPFLYFYLFSLDVTATTTANNVFLYLLANISIHMIATVFTFLAIQLFKLRKIKNIKMVSVLLCGLFLTMILNTSSQFTDHFVLGSFIISSVSTIVYITIGMIFINKYTKYEDREKELSGELKLQKIYNNSFKKTLLDLRGLKHDQGNHYSSILSMLKRNSIKEAISYIEELQTNILNINTAIYNVENAALYGIISSKMSKANAAGVKFNLNVVGETSTIPNVKITEICELFGIFLDNAIEAAETSNDKIVELLIANYPTYIEIKISNTCKEVPNFQKIKNDGYSTKGKDRGHGLAIAESILKKYKNITSETKFFDVIMSYDQIITIKKTPEI